MGARVRPANDPLELHRLEVLDTTGVSGAGLASRRTLTTVQFAREQRERRVVDAPAVDLGKGAEHAFAVEPAALGDSPRRLIRRLRQQPEPRQPELAQRPA